MGMKLLSKNEFDKAKAAEQMASVQEGAKLAKRIDNLREVASEEEASLEKFRRETIGNIHVQITTEIQKRDNLTKEVSDLEDRKKSALVPLTEEWDKVRAYSRSLDADRESLDSYNNALGARQIAVADRERGTEAGLKRAEDREAHSADLLKKSVQDREGAVQAIESARLLKRESEEAARLVKVELTHREELVASREESATLKETDISAREKKLADGLRLLRDQEEMLARDLKRLFQK